MILIYLFYRNKVSKKNIEETYLAYKITFNPQIH